MLDSRAAAERPRSIRRVPAALDAPVPAPGVGAAAKRRVLLGTTQGPGPSATIPRDKPLVFRTMLFSKVPAGERMEMAVPEALTKRQLRMVIGPLPARRSTRALRGERVR